MKRLRFLHIPKTAGSTFTSILYRQFHDKKRFEFTGRNLDVDVRRFQALSDKDRENTILFIGHTLLRTGIPEVDYATTITFLRRPLDRVQSFCQHVYEGKSPYLRNDFPPESFNLDLFLDSGNEELANLQTKLLIEDGSLISSSVFNRLPASTARDLALESLHKNIAFFGLSEYFDESLFLLSSALNWKTPLYATRNQKSRTRQIVFEQRQLDRIAELNQIDIEVYKVAQDNFMNLLNLSGLDNEKLNRFRLLNSLLSKPLYTFERIKAFVEALGPRRQLGNKS
jgi:Sulfotransferase family